MGFFKKAAMAFAARKLLDNDNVASRPASLQTQPVNNYGAIAPSTPPETTRTPSRQRKRQSRISPSGYGQRRPASYKHTLLKYTLTVPLSSILALLFLAAIKITVWPYDLKPAPLREVLTAAGAWTVSFALRTPLFYLATAFGTLVNGWTGLLNTFLQAVLEEALRLSVLVLLHIQLQPDPDYPDWDPLPNTADPAFTRVWWIAIGWTVADVCVAIVQGYQLLGLYRDVLPSTDEHHSRSPTHTYATISSKRAGKLPQYDAERPPSQTSDRTPSPTQPYPVRPQSVRAIESVEDLESQISHLLTLKSRAEVEQVYGTPVPSIPLFLFSLQRFDSILLNLGLTLLVSAAYLGRPSSSGWFNVDVLRAIWPTLLAVVGVHFILAAMWTTQGVLTGKWRRNGHGKRRWSLGVHGVAYVGLLISLGTVWAGLGYWYALV